jgi:hypothetical protein
MGAPPIVFPAVRPALIELLISPASDVESGETAPATVVDPDYILLINILLRLKRGLILLHLPQIKNVNSEDIVAHIAKTISSLQVNYTFSFPKHLLPYKLNPSEQEEQIEPRLSQVEHGS